MITQFIERKLVEKSTKHRAELRRLGKAVEEEPLSKNVEVLEQTPQVKAMNAIIQDRDTPTEDFMFYFDRLATVLIEQ
jgi:uridine kinase